MAIEDRLSAMLTERGIPHDVFHFTSGKWEIRYSRGRDLGFQEHGEFRGKIVKESLIIDQDWLDLPVIDDTQTPY
jgi:hypothetical protein